MFDRIFHALMNDYLEEELQEWIAPHVTPPEPYELLQFLSSIAIDNMDDPEVIEILEKYVTMLENNLRVI